MTDAPNPARGLSPGPWRMSVRPYADGTPFCRIEAGEGCYDLRGDGADTGFEVSGIVSKANARLMTAAPALLAAAEWAQQFIDDNWETFAAHGLSDEIEDAKAAAELLDKAIDAARGQPTVPDPKAGEPPS